MAPCLRWGPHGRSNNVLVLCHPGAPCVGHGLVVSSCSKLASHDSELDEEVAASVLGTFPEHMRIFLTTLQSEFKLFRERRGLCYILPSDLVGASCESHSGSNDNNTSNMLAFKTTGEGTNDLTARVGIVVFFRLLGSLQRSRNTRGILKLIRQVPAMIANTPPLALWRGLDAPKLHTQFLPTDGLTSTTRLGDLTIESNPGGVVESIMSAAEELVSGGHSITVDEQGEVLAVLVGLTIKHGSLEKSLRVLELLLFSTCIGSQEGGQITLPGVEHYLKVCRWSLLHFLFVAGITAPLCKVSAERLANKV